MISQERLVVLYADIFRFLAETIELHSMGTAKRVWKAFCSLDQINRFEQNCHEHVKYVEDG